MQINVVLQQRGWSGRTRDVSHMSDILSLALTFGSSRARTSGPILTINQSINQFYSICHTTYFRAEVPFRPMGRVDTRSPFCGHISLTPHFGDLNKYFQV